MRGLNARQMIDVAGADLSGYDNNRIVDCSPMARMAGHDSVSCPLRGRERHEQTVLARGSCLVRAAFTAACGLLLEAV